MHLIDTHCHLNFSQFDSDRKKLLEYCQAIGVKDIIVPGVKAEDWSQLLNTCAQSTLLHPALGLHPLFLADHKPEHLLQLKDFIENNKIIAIGEIGLDFYLPDHDKQAQIDLFSAQLALAQAMQLPVLLHVRKAHDQTISLLKKYPVLGGIVHAFNGSLQQAEHYQQLGFVFGVGGAITYPKATRLRSLFSQLPLSSIVLETDAPDMPLLDMQGQRNSPENIPLILDALSSIRSESREEIATITARNAKKILPL